MPNATTPETTLPRTYNSLEILRATIRGEDGNIATFMDGIAIDPLSIRNHLNPSALEIIRFFELTVHGMEIATRTLGETSVPGSFQVWVTENCKYPVDKIKLPPDFIFYTPTVDALVMSVFKIASMASSIPQGQLTTRDNHLPKGFATDFAGAAVLQGYEECDHCFSLRNGEPLDRGRLELLCTKRIGELLKKGDLDIRLIPNGENSVVQRLLGHSFYEKR